MSNTSATAQAGVVIPIDFLRVFIAGVAVHFLGFILYSLSGLGKRWYIGHRPLPAGSPKGGSETPSKNTRGRAKSESAPVAKHGHPAVVMILSFLSGLLTAFVVAHVLVFTKAFFHEEGIKHAITSAVWNFIGFDLTYTIFNAVWLDTALFSVGLDLVYHLLKQILIAVVLEAPNPFA